MSKYVIQSCTMKNNANGDNICAQTDDISCKKSLVLLYRFYGNSPQFNRNHNFGLNYVIYGKSQFI